MKRAIGNATKCFCRYLTSAVMVGGAVVLGCRSMSAQVQPTVHVVADSNEGLNPSKVKELNDSASDLREQIEKRRDIVLADDMQAADIVITILDRRIEIEQTRQDYGGGHIQNHYQSRHLIVYRIRSGDFHQNAEYFAAGSLVTWKRVAKDLSKQIERWARENPDQIRQQRAEKN